MWYSDEKDSDEPLALYSDEKGSDETPYVLEG